jgi:hypothetical protein
LILGAYAIPDDAQKFSHDPELLNYWGFSHGTVIG